MRPRAPRSGGILLEVVVVCGLLALVAFPLVSSLRTAGFQAVTTEDYMLAEAMAERYLQEALSIPYGNMFEKLPLDVELKGVPAGDEKIAACHAEYRNNLEGSESLVTRIHVEEARPGLLWFEVTVSWPIRPGSTALRTYTLTRMKARPDLAMRTTYPIPVPSPSADGRGGSR